VYHIDVCLEKEDKYLQVNGFQCPDERLEGCIGELYKPFHDPFHGEVLSFPQSGL
jgi:hypothetical protein